MIVRQRYVGNGVPRFPSIALRAMMFLYLGSTILASVFVCLSSYRVSHLIVVATDETVYQRSLSLLSPTNPFFTVRPNDDENLHVDDRTSPWELLGDHACADFGCQEATKRCQRLTARRILKRLPDITWPLAQSLPNAAASASISHTSDINLQ